MNSKRKLLFWGELPPEVVHGISLSNERILSALSNDFDIVKVEDKASFHGLLKTLYYFFVSLLKLIHFSIKQQNLYYLNAPMSYLGLLKAYISIITVKIFSPSVKVVSHLHRGDFLQFVEHPRNKRLFKYFATQLNYLLVLSETASLELSKHSLIEQNKVKVLYNSISLSRSKAMIANKAFDTGGKDKFYCLCNYIPTKRIHNLVEVVNDIPVTEVIFNGTLSSESYMVQLRQLDIGSICKFEGVVKSTEKEDRISESKALLLPSLNEGMPLVILESLAQGTPVICFDVGYISDYVGKDYPGLVNELNDQALKEKIKWLEQLSDEEYLRLRELSFQLFWQRFDPAMIDTKITGYFNNM